MADSSAGEETSDAVMEDSLPSDPSLVASPGATGVPPPPPHSAGAAPLDGDMPVEPNAAPIPGIGLDSGAFAGAFALWGAGESRASSQSRSFLT